MWLFIIPTIILFHYILLVYSIFNLNKCIFIYSGSVLFLFIILKLLSLAKTKVVKTSNFINIPFNNPKIITYNLNNLPLFNKETKNLPELMNHLSQFDIIAIQESYYDLFNSTDKEHLIKKLVESGFNILTQGSPSFFSLQWQDGGLLIATKFKITDYKMIPYYSKASIDALSQKGILFCKLVDSKGDVINLINTHAQAGYVNQWPDDGLHVDVRIKQLSKINEELNKLSGNIILLGDFNFRSDEEAEIIKSKFEYSFINELDAIFSTFPISEINHSNPFDSDHYSVEAKVETI
jgi:endonuclease/exonuclease/phosphatase family metal-dependent hydrolase